MALPIYQEQYKEAGLPSPRMSGFDADAYGAQVWRGVQGFGDALRVKIEEFEDAETLEAINNFRREMDTYHQDPTKGILNLRQGKNAMNLANDSLQYMTDKQTEYMSKFASQRQRNNFERMSHDYIDRRHSSNMNFETQNIDKYELEQAQANIELHSDAIMGCIGAETNADYESHLGAIDESIVFMARKYGWSDEQLEAAVRATRDKATINRLQAWADKDWESAYEWYSGTARQNIPNYGVVSSYAYGGTAGSMKPGQYVGGHTALQGGTEGLISQYDNYIKQYANTSGVDPNLVRAVMYCESGGKSNSVSSAGARGLMQLMPDTAKGLGVDPDDPEQNIRGGVAYLAQMLQQQGGDVELALAAYNAGPGNVKKHGGIPPFKETQNYVKKVMSKYREYTRLGGGKEYIGDGVRGTAEGLTSMITGGTVLTQTSEFGVDRGTHKHGGYDYAASVGTKLYAPTTSDSFVLNYGYDPKGYGHWVSLKDENGIEWRYAHLSAPTRDLPEKGAIVRPGDLVALSGNSGRSTGPHVHVEVLKDGDKINPYDYLGGRKAGTPAMFNVPRLPREDGKGIRATLSSAAREKLDDYFETFEAQQIARSMMADSHYSSPTGLADGRDVLDTAIMDASLKKEAIKAYQNEWTNASTRRVALEREQAKAQNAVYEGYQLSMANGRYPTVEEVMSANMDAGQKATIINAINREIASADKEARAAQERLLKDDGLNDYLRQAISNWDDLDPDQQERIFQQAYWEIRTGDPSRSQRINEKTMEYLRELFTKDPDLIRTEDLTALRKDHKITRKQEADILDAKKFMTASDKADNDFYVDEFKRMFEGKNSELQDKWGASRMPSGTEELIASRKKDLIDGLIRIGAVDSKDRPTRRKVLFDGVSSSLKADLIRTAQMDGISIKTEQLDSIIPNIVWGTESREVPGFWNLLPRSVVPTPVLEAGGETWEAMKGLKWQYSSTPLGSFLLQKKPQREATSTAIQNPMSGEVTAFQPYSNGFMSPYRLSMSMFGHSGVGVTEGDDGGIVFNAKDGDSIRALPAFEGMRISRAYDRPKSSKEGDFLAFRGQIEGLGEVEFELSNIGAIGHTTEDTVRNGDVIGRTKGPVTLRAKVGGKYYDPSLVLNYINRTRGDAASIVEYASQLTDADLTNMPKEEAMGWIDFMWAMKNKGGRM